MEPNPTDHMNTKLACILSALACIVAGLAFINTFNPPNIQSLLRTRPATLAAPTNTAPAPVAPAPAPVPETIQKIGQSQTEKGLVPLWIVADNKCLLTSRYTPKLLRLADGWVVEFGDVAQVLTPEQVKEIYAPVTNSVEATVTNTVKAVKKKKTAAPSQ